MSRNSQTRRLALSVAVALSAGGGALFPVMPHAFAADVTGNNVTVNSSSAPELGYPAITGGAISSVSDAGNVTGNTLTMDGVSYTGGSVLGGDTVGTGNVQGNKLFLQNGANITGFAIGGRTRSGGDATGNEINISGATTNATGFYVVGGLTDGATGNAGQNKAIMSDGTATMLYGGLVVGPNSTGNATGNEVTFSGGTVNNDVVGGFIKEYNSSTQATGNVSGSIVNISGGTVNGTTYGGLTQGTGSVTGSTVTISGGSVHDVLGGRSLTGDASTNTLNFQGATADNLIGGRVAGTNAAGNVATNTVTVTSGTINNDVRGGEIIAPTATGNVSGNIVNINGGTIGGAVTAGYNMGTGNVDGGNTVNVTNGSITGVVTGGHGTHAGEVSGNKVNVTNGTLSDNIIGGFAEDTGTASTNEVTITGGTLSGTTIDGGFSVNGKASGNTATVGGISFAGVVTGGRGGAGADTNKVFLKNSAGITGNAYGGRVLSGGNVTGNELTIEASGATVSGVAVGGQNDVAAGDVTDNKAYMNAGSAARLIGGVVNGVGATGKASGNRAEVSNGSSAFIAGALISDTGATGEASDNHAVVSGASAALGSIYGGITNGTGAAKNNTATISGSINASDVVGGQSVTGNAERNEASFTQATVTNVRGARITGSGTGSAINNKATIAGGTVGAAAAAEIQNAAATGAVQDNTLTVTGGTVNGDSYGGVTYGTGDAVHNGTVVSGSSTHLSNVYGGSAASGSATKNYVTFADASAQGITVGRVQSGAGTVSENNAEMTSGSIVNGVTGGLSYGSGTVEKNEVKISGGTVGGVILGGQNAGTGAASSNIVELTGGTINATVYGGSANSGAADSNKVTVKKDVMGNVFGGRAGGSASGNTVDLGAVTVTGNVTGGFGNATSNNTVNMDGSTVGGVITVGSAGGTDNTLTVKGTNSAGNITGFQSAIFDLGSTVTSPNAMVNLTGGASTNIDWRTLGWIGMATGARTLLSNTNGFTISYYALNGTFVSETTTHEYFIDTDTHSDVGAKKINLDEYQFKGAVVSKSADPDADIWAGRSKHGNTTQDNELTITGSSTTKNAYGGWTSGTGTTNADKNDSMNNKVNLNGGTLADVYGGYTESVGGKATGNTVNVAGGTAVNVVGGQSIGEATENIVNVTANFTGNVTGGKSTGSGASKNVINIGAVSVGGNVTGGQGVTATNDNTVNIAGTTVTGTITGGTVAGASGNTLTVQGANTAGNLAGFQTLNFDTATANSTNPMLNLTTGATTLDWNAIKPTGKKTGRIVLLQNTAGGAGLSFGTTYSGAKTDADDTTEYNIDTDTHGSAAQQVISESYQFKGVTDPVTIGTPADVFGGISKVGNSTRENEISVSGGSYTNAYGGHTDGTGTQKQDKNDSYKNKITISGATVAGTVYGGYTTAGTGTATKNEVNVTGGTVNNVVGGFSAAGAASDNTINLGAVTITGNVTGGEGTATNDNKVNVEGTTVNGVISGGNNATSGNTLTVKGANTAGNLAGFQTLNFDTATANSTDPMLNLTTGVTTLDWNAINLTGKKTGRIVLLQNTAGGAGLSFGTTYTGLKTDADDTTEFNIDTDTHAAAAQQVISESYQFKGVTSPVQIGTPADVYGGISKVGNSTRENEITVLTGNYDNAYGGHTDGTGTAKDDKDNSYKNKVKLSGTANINDTVYGGYTTATTGKTWENTVNIEGGSAANVVGAKSAGNATRNTVNVTANYTGNVTGGISTAGIAEENTVNLDHVTVTGDVTGGQGATLANKNVVNMDNAAVTGTVKAAATIGAGNTLTVKGTNRAGNIAGVQRVSFNVSGASSANTLLTLTDGAVTDLDWSAVETKGSSTNKINLLTHTNANNDKLLHIEHYNGVKTGRDTDDTTEFNIDTDTHEAEAQHVVSESYRYRGQTERVEMDGNVYGGISKVGNATRENTIDVSSGGYTDAFGGYTDVPPIIGSDNAKSKEKGNSHDNTITISGASVSGTVYGGYTKAASGTAKENTVNVTGGSAATVVGAQSTGDATGNKVNVSGGNVGAVIGSVSAGAASNNEITLKGDVTVGSVLGGQGATTTDNKVNLEGATVNGLISGGNNVTATSGNTLTVKGTNSAGNLAGFQTVKFDLATGDASKTMLSLTNGTATKIDWASLKADGTATGVRTLLSNTNGFTISNYALNGTFVSETRTHEYFIDTDTHSDVGAKKINIDEYQFKGAAVSKSADPAADIWAGRSKHGNTTQDNELTITGSSTTKNAYGGWTSGTGTTNADKNDSMNNKVNLNGGTLADVYGGYTTSVGGKATGNTVNIAGGTAVNVVGGQSIGDATGNTVNVTANFTGNVTGGKSTGSGASKNVINLGAVSVDGNVTGGQGVTTDDNVIHLNKTTVTGTITGGTASSGKGNTLVVHPGASQAQSLAGLQNINFFLDDTHDKTVPILKLTTTGTQDLRGVGVGVGVIDGAHPVYRINEQFSLIKAPGGTIQTDATIRNTSSAMQGVSLRYEFDVAQTATNEVSAVVKKAKLTEQTKSLVETRAGATAFINQGTDFLVSNNIQAAKTAAAAEKAEHADGYALWAGLGASNMRAETGSYVESKGWNLGIGWAREHEMDAGKIVYGPFVSYGNGTYDSYLDDNTHGSGKFRTLGLGLMARVDQNNGMWFEGSLQGGRAKSDYSGVIYSGTNSEYDVSSTYWAGHFGVGKNIQLKENETINPYLRYFWSHQAGSNATLKNNGRAGESYEFSSVSSQRIRLGFRYTNRNAADGEFYAGLALEYEFDGSANASYQGYSTLRPSLKGSSGMLELGYRFAPKDGNVTYDFSLAGWQGKRRGLSGDLGVKWMF